MQSGKWTIDKKRGITEHTNGLRVEIQNGEVTDILTIPDGIPTHQLPGFLAGARQAYKADHASAKVYINQGKGC